MTLGEKIKFGRKKLGLSKEDFASILNVSLEEVQSIENNELLPDTNKMIQISNVLDFSLDYLLKDNFSNSSTKEKSNNQNKEEITNVEFISIDQNDIADTENKDILVENNKQNINDHSYNKCIKQNKYKLIKIWSIIGVVLSPLALTSSFVYLGPCCYLCLLYYVVSIPLCIYILKLVKNSKNRDELIKWGIISLFFVSIISGILILTLKDEDYSNEEVIVKSQKNKVKQEKEEKFINKLQELGYTNINHSIKIIKKLKIDDNIKQEAYQKLNVLKNDCKNIKSYDDLNKFNKEVKKCIPKKKRSRKRITLLIVILSLIIASFGSLGGILINDGINYKIAVDNISTYKVSNNETIEKSLYRICFNYDGIDKLKEEYNVVKNCTSKISANISTNYGNYLNKTISKNNRKYLTEMFIKINLNNGSNKWYLGNYLSTICIPSIINDEYLTYASLRLKWTYYSSGFEMETNLPFPRNVNTSKVTGCRLIYNTNENKMYFYLMYSNGYSYEYFNINNLTYNKKNGKFYVDVYSFYYKKTYSFEI